jgi:type II restriction/modification system DNA methylase subunit YeeA
MKKATLQADGSWNIEDLTSEEETNYNAITEHGKALQAEIKTAAEKKATDAAAGKAKLKELGLTDDQIAALVG